MEVEGYQVQVQDAGPGDGDRDGDRDRYVVLMPRRLSQLFVWLSMVIEIF